MIGRLNHVAIAVRDVLKAAELYKQALGGEISDPVPQPDHGVTTLFITLPNTKIELIAPLGESSPILKFLDRNPDGGIHHVCYEVETSTPRVPSSCAKGCVCLETAARRSARTARLSCFCIPKILAARLSSSSRHRNSACCVSSKPKCACRAEAVRSSVQ